MQSHSLTTNSAAETVHAAKRWFDGIKRHLDGFAVLVLFTGDLGAGKTQFVKGIALSLGIEESTVLSPSFTYVREYQIPSGKLFHLDLWRAGAAEVQQSLGILDMVQIGNVVAVEWSEHLELDLSALTNVEAYSVSMQGSGDQRAIQIQAVSLD